MTNPTKRPAFPTHCFTVARLYLLNGEYTWGNLTDAFVDTLDAAVDLVADAFAADELGLSAETIKVCEIDGAVVMDRTDDVLSMFVVYPLQTWIANSSGGGALVYRAALIGSEAAEEWLQDFPGHTLKAA